MQSYLNLFDEPDGPKGLHYRPEFITPAREQDFIAKIREFPLLPFQFGQYEGKRRVMSFGWHYDFASRTLQETSPFPEWLLPLIGELEAAEDLPRGSVGHVLFTEYEAGTGIGWHRDKKQFDKVFGLSLASSCIFRFRRRSGTGWQRYSLRAEPRSLYTLADEARSVWEHSIPPVDALRYSVTFRTMTAAAHEPR